VRLTRFGDYSLRVLMYAGLREGVLVTIDDVAQGYGISRNHLMKVVTRLGQLGYLETVRGKGGGMRLARRPELIVIGRVLRQVEDDFALLECFESNGSCVVEPSCLLKDAVAEALDAFFAVLDRYTLADLIGPRRRLLQLLGVPAVPAR
jgi:Rrf2 family nitric oxide-sensitive transcriptional repressor